MAKLRGTNVGELGTNRSPFAAEQRCMQATRLADYSTSSTTSTSTTSTNYTLACMLTTMYSRSYHNIIQCLSACFRL